MKKNLFFLVLFLTYSCEVNASWSPSEEYLKHISWEKIQGDLWLSKETLNDLSSFTHNVLIPREKEYCDTHVVFYHAQKRGFLVYYDFQKKLKKALQGLLKKSPYTFEYLRSTADFYCGTGHILDFLKEYNFANFGKRFDHRDDIQKILLSTSLCFPGNYDGECSFCFYTYEYSANAPSPYNLFADSIRPFGVKDLQVLRCLNDLNELFSAVNALEIKYGLLVQIFIPNEYAARYCYLSHPYGIPRQENESMQLLSADIVKNIFMSEALRDSWKFRHSPETETYQARILLHKDLFAAPCSGIKMFKYHTIPADIVLQYERKLDSIVKSLVPILIRAEFENTFGGRYIS